MAKCMCEAPQYLDEWWECVLRVLDQFWGACSAQVFLVADLFLPALLSSDLTPQRSHGCSWRYSAAICCASGAFSACGAHHGHTEPRGLLSTDTSRAAIMSERQMYPWRQCRHNPCSLTKMNICSCLSLILSPWPLAIGTFLPLSSLSGLYLFFWSKTQTLPLPLMVAWLYSAGFTL